MKVNVKFLFSVFAVVCLTGACFVPLLCADDSDAADADSTVTIKVDADAGSNTDLDKLKSGTSNTWSVDKTAHTAGFTMDEVDFSTTSSVAIKFSATESLTADWTVTISLVGENKIASGNQLGRVTHTVTEDNSKVGNHINLVLSGESGSKLTLRQNITDSNITYAMGFYLSGSLTINGGCEVDVQSGDIAPQSNSQAASIAVCAGKLTVTGSKLVATSGDVTVGNLYNSTSHSYAIYVGTCTFSDESTVTLASGDMGFSGTVGNNFIAWSYCISVDSYAGSSGDFVIDNSKVTMTPGSANAKNGADSGGVAMMNKNKKVDIRNGSDVKIKFTSAESTYGTEESLGIYSECKVYVSASRLDITSTGCSNSTTNILGIYMATTDICRIDNESLMSITLYNSESEKLTNSLGIRGSTKIDDSCVFVSSGYRAFTNVEFSNCDSICNYNMSTGATTPLNLGDYSSNSMMASNFGATISFDSNNNVLNMKKVDSVTLGEYPTEKVPEGKKFDHYQVNGVRYKAGSTISADALLAIVPIFIDTGATSVTVTYDTVGGSDPAPVQSSVKVGSFFEVKDYKGTKEGYKFMGWSYNGKTYTAGEQIVVTGGPVVLKAVWKSTSSGGGDSSGIIIAIAALGAVLGIGGVGALILIGRR